MQALQANLCCRQKPAAPVGSHPGFRVGQLTQFDLFVRHAPRDAGRAAVLTKALRAFGYAVDVGAGPPDHLVSAERFAAHAAGTLVLWSPAAATDDELIWEAAQCARFDAELERGDQLYEVLLEPTPCRIQARSTNVYSSGPNATQRLSSFYLTDLSGWTGAVDDDRLAPLLWELPPARGPTADVTFERPADRDDAEWRATVAMADPAAFGTYFDSWRLGWGNDRHAQAERLADKMGVARTIMANPDVWTRFGAEARQAASLLSRDGGAALHAFGMRLKAGELDGATDAAAVTHGDRLLLAIQICAVDHGPLLTLRDHRTRADLERAAALGQAEAMHRFADDIIRGEDRQRGMLLLERAAARDHLPAFFLLGVFSDKPIDKIRWWKHGAERGCSNCIEALADAYEGGVEGLQRNPRRAFEIRAAAPAERLGYMDKAALARALWDGKVAPRDRDRAVRLLFEAAVAGGGNLQACVHIGDLYLHGRGGMARDVDEAVAWYISARGLSETDAAAYKRLRALRRLPEDWVREDFELREAAGFWSPR